VLLILGSDLSFHNEIWVLRSSIVIEPLPALFDLTPSGCEISPFRVASGPLDGSVLFELERDYRLALRLAIC